MIPPALRPEFPPHAIPREQPTPDLAQRTPPIGGWAFHDPQPSRAGWHIACPSCLAGRVLLAPDPDDPFEYEIRSDTCTAGCPTRDVMRWFAVREGDMRIFFAWLDNQKTRRAA